MALTRSQIERLGLRLVATDQPADDDLALLHELLLTNNATLRIAVARVRDELGLLPTSRIKNTGTILEKLHRHGGSWLKSIQDIAGMRVTGSFNLATQNHLVEGIVTLFSGEQRQPRVIDRRAAPMHGYRAVHVVAYPGGTPLEIQVRTKLQHEWAELFEKLADRVGRRIRYGEDPDAVLPADLAVAPPALQQSFLADQRRLRLTLIRHAQLVAGAIGTYESDEGRRSDEMLRFISAELDYLRDAVSDL